MHHDYLLPTLAHRDVILGSSGANVQNQMKSQSLGRLPGAPPSNNRPSSSYRQDTFSIYKKSHGEFFFLPPIILCYSSLSICKDTGVRHSSQWARRLLSHILPLHLLVHHNVLLADFAHTIPLQSAALPGYRVSPFLKSE